MPLTSIEIEQIRPDRWVGFIEAGTAHLRRRNLQALSIEEIIAEQLVAYCEFSDLRCEGADAIVAALRGVCGLHPEPEPVAAPPDAEPQDDVRGHVRISADAVVVDVGSETTEPLRRRGRPPRMR